VAGGGGKSPLTMHLVELLRGMGREVVVSASGYGSPRSEAATLAPSGALNPKEWGDEPAMLRWLIPDLPLIVGRRRVLAAEICHESHRDAILLMDDGFQHLPLKKHVSILLDPPKPFNRLCLPAGPYREPRRNRARADLVLPGKFSIEQRPLRFVEPNGSVTYPMNPSALCALGRPEAFMEALARSGVTVSSKIVLPDHDALDAGTLLGSIPHDRPVVVTAKDWVKLRERADVDSRSFVIALQTTRIEPASQFREWLKNRLDAKSA
jgi:tetraacyldisaccharide 4'-kinase